ncbi:hypothetical protein AJ79_10230 [Helicocarpus griseus UAMH5409]|uniref:PHD-type domain-containing protein n=1 Tax=Helicocarpus griseus UAMH5409 TaxID=1447875 RepID=A0A2B7WEY1_9EURO|nr:hypothetical protein AJ79_10230 [Helicocarpus griseus UAMH5409]
MVSRKRAREEAEDSTAAHHAAKRSEPPSLQNGLGTAKNGDGGEQHGGLLQQLRNMWEFSNLVQYIYSFGKVVKIGDDVDIDELETECLKPGPSGKLLDIGLALLKFVSSHRGLTSENFEEYTRRQYLAKAPSRNPFGDAEEPIKFHDLDIFQRIRVLQQLTVWTFWNPDRMRERLPEQKETEQVQWRVDEIGYDRDERVYYVLDDNRLYRRTDPPIPAAKPAKPKANSKKGRALARAARKRQLAGIKDEEDEEAKNEANGDAEHDPSGYYKWECVAITLAQYNAFLDTIKKSKDPNDEFLREQLVENIIPVIEKVEESHRRKIERKEKELINMQRMANAKRSSRIASKHDRERQEMEAAEEARRREAERIAAIKEQEKQKKIEKERQYRMMTREQRLKDREEKRRLHEEELARIAEESKKIESGEARMSSRQLKSEMEKRKKDLEALQDEEQWVFDCSGCGVHGENLDDGSHIVACEKCNVWQHSKCLGIAQEEAEKDDFHFVCNDCKRRMEEANRPKIPPLKFRVGTSASPSAKKTKKLPSTSPAQPAPLPPMSTMTNGLPGSPSQRQPFPPSRLPPAPQPAPNPAQPGSSLAPSPFPPTNGTSNALPRPQVQQIGPAPQFLHYQPHGANSNASSFSTQRPSSSHSAQGASFVSPVQNRPAMSPTQGNRDVGPLAGFPPSNLPNGSLPATPHGHNRAQAHHQHTTTSPYAIPNSSNPSRPAPSFSSTSTGATATPARNSFTHTPPPPQYPHQQTAPPISGLSPTKHSPAHPPTSSFNSTGTTATTAPILPPVQRLQPSPKLMGRASPDAPIPAPVKSMTPEQEDRRRRENEMAMAARGLNSGQGLSYSPDVKPQMLEAVVPPQGQEQRQSGSKPATPAEEKTTTTQG